MRRPRPFRTTTRTRWSTAAATTLLDAGTAELHAIRDRRLSEAADGTDDPRPDAP